MCAAAAGLQVSDFGPWQGLGTVYDGGPERGGLLLAGSPKLRLKGACAHE